MKKNSIITLVVCLLIVAVTAYFLFFYKKDESKNAKTTSLQADSENTQKSVSVFPLKRGSKGAVVSQLQQKLNLAILANPNSPIKKLVIDGSYGDKTEAAVQWYFSNTNKTNVWESEFNTISASGYAGSKVAIKDSSTNTYGGNVIAALIHSDIQGLSFKHDRQLYENLLALPDAEFLKVCKDYKSYFGESLGDAMRGDWFTFPPTGYYPDILARMERLKI